MSYIYTGIRPWANKYRADKYGEDGDENTIKKALARRENSIKIKQLIAKLIQLDGKDRLDMDQVYDLLRLLQ